MNIGSVVDMTFAHLCKLGLEIAQRRRPGMEPAVIVDKVRSLNLDVPEELVQLYSICDGTETSVGEQLDNIQFIPGYYWMKLEEVIEAYQSIANGSQWNCDWLPILANGGGDFYAVVCSKHSEDYGSVVGFILGETDNLVEFQSVGTLFKTIEKSFAEKAFFVVAGYLEADYPRMRAIASMMQPGFIEHDA